MIRQVEYEGLQNCLEISNGDSSVIISTEFGPRVLSYSLDGGPNILGWHPDAEVKTELGIWKPYGGHRLWLAPENMPLSYEPDNEPVEFGTDERTEVSASVKGVSGIEKHLRVILDQTGSGVTLEHRLTNRGAAAIRAAAWALTIMRPGGEAVVPNEPFAAYDPDNLLPVRTMSLWSYTDLTDPRWHFGKETIGLRVDENLHSQQKFGVLNKQGWAGYKWQDLMFVKKFEYIADAEYPDMNSNVEVYTAGGFVELETLSPLKMLSPGDSIDHRERWELRQNTRAEQDLAA